MEVFIEFIKALAPGIVVGIVLSYWNKKQNKRDSAITEAEKTHIRSEKVKLSLLLATAKLSYATAMAIKRGTPNGEMEDAIDRYGEALGEFREFERQKVSEL